MANASVSERQEVTNKYDLYDLLGVNDDADETAIRKAFRRTALKYHPDKNKTATAVIKFHALTVAVDVLCDAESRKQYDEIRQQAQARHKREAAFDARRRQMKADLERNERNGWNTSATSASTTKQNPSSSSAAAREAKLARLRAQSAALRAQRDADKNGRPP
ncbi:DnaJ domain-containing protein [Lipomyces japonicus]|uniref:DnaJ domain-containing protein n=1 Tax=Lipomyces japonicus TaxID=56871 RepID=UPI0034CFB468